MKETIKRGTINITRQEWKRNERERIEKVRKEEKREKRRLFRPKRGFNQRRGCEEGCLMVVIERKTPPTDALLRNVFVHAHACAHTQTHTHTHTRIQHTRLLLDCGYSGLYPAKPPQANTVHSDMEIFY